MLKISNSQWVNTVSLLRMVINLYSFWVKIRKAFYSWIPWPATATFSKQTRLKWRVSPPSTSMCPLPTCFSRQQSCCAGVVFLFRQQQFPAPAPEGQKGEGRHFSATLYSLSILRSEGRQKDFTLDLSSLSSFSKAVAWHERPFCDASWLLFSPFLIQSNVLTMGVFPDSGLALTLCSSVSSSAPLRRWVASGPFVSRNTASDLHTNPWARKNSCTESFLPGVLSREAMRPSGSPFILWASVFSSFLQTSRFSEIHCPCVFGINSCWTNRSWAGGGGGGCGGSRGLVKTKLQFLESWAALINPLFSLWQEAWIFLCLFSTDLIHKASAKFKSPQKHHSSWGDCGVTWTFS